ncbi:MAG: GntR family transcriptional regulator [Acidobacteria bacterium]|nr:GntR family transcriptional regulator [Acidobacteriota bacterium]
MLVDLDPSDPRPVFRQIADEVQRSVALGILKPNDALPAVRQLAAELSVNANTVQHAYQTLEREGAVYVRRGIGTFIGAATGGTRDRQKAAARQIAERMMRDAFRHGLRAEELIAALNEIAPVPRKIRKPRRL